MKKHMPAPPRYDCDRCGACCRHLVVYADYTDHLREPKLAEVVARQGRRINLPLLAAGEHTIMLREAGRKGCPFLAADGPGHTACTIYPTRPGVCEAFTAGSEQCQESREMAKLPPLPAVK